MSAAVKIALAVSAFVVLGAIALPLYIYLASEATIERRYPLPTVSEFQAQTGVTRGDHLARVAGCTGCHAPNLEGRRMQGSKVPGLWSANLRIALRNMSDEDFERALRRGIAPDATTLWDMPSFAYTYMSDKDVGALLLYLRASEPGGRVRPRPVWNRQARLALIEGRIVPAVLAVRDAAPSLDLGPRYDGGRYLARIACSECHGSDLAGSAAAPDLDAIRYYDRNGFFDLLRRGRGVRSRRVAVMARLAAQRFRYFADYEIMALYDYLQARAHAPPALVARAKANETRRRAATAAESDD